jgi:hypothetical protein
VELEELLDSLDDLLEDSKTPRLRRNSDLDHLDSSRRCSQA